MSRLLFIPNDGELTGDLLELYLCREHGIPKEFDQNFHIIATSRYPRAELGGAYQCFLCGKTFDGNEAATNVIIELTPPRMVNQ